MQKIQLKKFTMRSVKELKNQKKENTNNNNKIKRNMKNKTSTTNNTITITLRTVSERTRHRLVLVADGGRDENVRVCSDRQPCQHFKGDAAMGNDSRLLHGHTAQTQPRANREMAASEYAVESVWWSYWECPEPAQHINRVTWANHQAIVQRAIRCVTATTQRSIASACNQ